MRQRIVASLVISLSACFDPDRSSSTATAGDSGTSSTGNVDPTLGDDVNPEDDGGTTGGLESTTATTDDPSATQATDPDSTGAETTGGTPVQCTAPELLGTLPTLSQTLGAAVWGSRGYVTHTNHGLLVLDLTDPTNPAQLGQIAIPNPTTVAVAGTTAYVGDPTGLYVIDASNGASPVQAAVVMDPSLSSVTGVAIDGGHVYVTDNDNGDPCGGCGLHVLDTTNLAIVATLPLADDVREVVIANDHAFVALGLEGLAIVDVGIPSAPELVTMLALPGFTFKLDADGDRLYAVQGDAGLAVLDISDPPNTTVLGSAGAGGFMSGVAIDGNWAWVTDMQPGLRVLDVGDPMNIVELGALDGFEQGAAITLGSAFALVGSYDAGARTVAPPVCE